MQTPDDAVERRSVPAVKSADRVLELLEDVAAHGPATRVELSMRTGIPRSSIHAVLRTMTARGWLELDRAGGAYRLGFRSVAVSAAFWDTDPTLRRAAPLLDRLAAVTGGTVHLGRLDGAHVVYLDKRESAPPAPMESAVGRRVPAYCTALGRALLATRPADVRATLVPQDIAPRTDRTVTDRPTVLAAIDRAARLGYAVESEETCPGVRCFSIALPTAGSPEHAVSVAVPLSRLDAVKERRIVDSLLRAAAGPRRPAAAPDPTRSSTYVDGQP